MRTKTFETENPILVLILYEFLTKRQSFQRLLTPLEDSGTFEEDESLLEEETDELEGIDLIFN